MIKLRFYLVIVSILVFWVLSTMFSGVVIREGLLGYVLVGGMFGIIVQFSSKLVRFLAIKENIFTSVIAYSVLAVILFFILNMLSPLIVFNNGVLKGFSTDLVVIKDFALDKNTTLALFAILCGTINALIDELRK